VAPSLCFHSARNLWQHQGHATQYCSAQLVTLHIVDGSLLHALNQSSATLPAEVAELGELALTRNDIDMHH
jgi:hypothetical protein